MLNKKLLEKNKVSNEQKENLYVLYDELEELFKRAKVENKSEEEFLTIANELTDLELNLQKQWNFPQNKLFHSYWYRLPGCTCFEDRNSSACPYHKEESYIWSKKAFNYEIKWCCMDCGNKHRVKNQYDGTMTIHDGNCEICREKKQVTSASKLFGHHIFM